MIRIAERLRPFCHLPGTSCLIPFSPWVVEAFPALLRLKNLISGETQELFLNTKGPILDFTVELDLEKGGVHIFGHSERGYQRFSIAMEENGIRIVSEKGRNKMVLPAQPSQINRSDERLSLGSHKALDWELVKRRRNLSEIFPVWFRLGQMVPEVPTPQGGAAELLKDYDKLEVCSNFLKIFLSGFEGILVPRSVDNDFQGIVETEMSGCPLGLLTEGSKLIRALFFQEVHDGFAFLPCLPPQFHAGRFLHLRTSFGDTIDLEWSKKLLRRAIIRPGMTREVQFHFQKAIKSFRGKGKRVSAETPFLLEAGKGVFLDRFES